MPIPPSIMFTGASNSQAWSCRGVPSVRTSPPRGLSEDALCIGDHLSIGSAEFVVTQPRLPCFKLGVRFQRADMVLLFQRSGRTGFYLAVLREGVIAAGEPIRVAAEGEPRVTVREIARLYTDDEGAQELLRRASGLEALPEDWKEYFRHRLWKPDS